MQGPAPDNTEHKEIGNGVHEDAQPGASRQRQRSSSERWKAAGQL